MLSLLWMTLIFIIAFSSNSNNCNNNNIVVWGLSTRPPNQQSSSSSSLSSLPPIIRSSPSSSSSSSTKSWMNNPFATTTNPSSWYSNTVHAMEHLLSSESLLSNNNNNKISLEDLTNTRIPGPKGSGIEIMSYIARPSISSSNDDDKKLLLPVLILIHEFFGLNESIISKANALADELNCIVIAPDTFRGQVTNFIPKAIWLALSTPTSRVNDDLDAICTYLEKESSRNENNVDLSKLAVMGFCYGGGKAIQYTTQRKPNAATVIFYGQPITDVIQLSKLHAPVCGIYGRDDIQFPMKLIDQFKSSLQEAGLESDNDNDNNSNIQVYDNVGHAFWKDMDQIRNGEQPQTDAYNQCTTFLRNYFYNNN